MTALLTIEEAHERCQWIGVRTFRLWVKEGRIGFTRLGGRLLFREEDIQAVIDSRYQGPKPQRHLPTS